MKTRSLRAAHQITAHESESAHRTQRDAAQARDRAHAALQRARRAMHGAIDRLAANKKGATTPSAPKAAYAFLLEQFHDSEARAEISCLLDEVNRKRRELRKAEEWVEWTHQTWRHHEAQRQIAARRVDEAHRQWKATLEKRRADDVDDRFADDFHRRPR